MDESWCFLSARSVTLALFILIAVVLFNVEFLTFFHGNSFKQMASSRVKSLIVITRHGHRAPGKPLITSSSNVSFWRDICYHPSHPEIAALDRNFSVRLDDSNSTPYDEVHFPWGALSRIGANHMRQIGSEIGAAFPDIRKGLKDGGVLTAIASNFRRTQMSAQFLLQGLIDPGSTANSVFIDVRNKSHCPLTFYDSKPELAKRLVMKTLTSSEFMSMDSRSEVVQAKDRMAQLFPVLGRQYYPPLSARKALSSIHILFSRSCSRRNI